MTHRNGKVALTRGLGWFSIALGAAQVAAPRVVARLIGVRSEDGRSAVMRAIGVRELATGVGILVRRRPAGWLWARAAGDALDLALLAAAERRDGRRVAAAMAAVASVAVPDLVESARLSRRGPIRVAKAITVNRSPDDVRRMWEEVWPKVSDVDVAGSGSVRFEPASGDRGTDVVVALEHGSRAGRAGAAVTKLAGRHPATRLTDDLHRFKQVVETGEIARSEAAPEGHALTQHLRRPAQPLPKDGDG